LQLLLAVLLAGRRAGAAALPRLGAMVTDAQRGVTALGLKRR